MAAEISVRCPDGRWRPATEGAPRDNRHERSAAECRRPGPVLASVAGAVAAGRDRHPGPGSVPRGLGRPQRRPHHLPPAGRDATHPAGGARLGRGARERHRRYGCRREPARRRGNDHAADPAPPGVSPGPAGHERHGPPAPALHDDLVHGRTGAPPYDQRSAWVANDEIAFYDDYEGGVDDISAVRAAVDAIGERPCAILRNHGAFTVGTGIPQAFTRSVSLEWRCRQAWHAAAIGGQNVVPEPGQRAIAEYMASGRSTALMAQLWEWAARREIRLDPDVLA